MIHILTQKENLIRTMKGAHPDRLVNQYMPFVPVMNDPIGRYTRGNRARGTTTKDRWGTTIVFPEDQFAAMPHVTNTDKVCPDVTEWKKYVKVPDLVANCTDWADALASAAQIDRNEHMVLGFMGTGIFEQLHFLMGFEDTLVNLLAEPEAMHDLIHAVAEYRYTYAKLLVENLKPDIILSHDDWGSKHSLFMSPGIWREFFKPHYARIYGMMHDHGVLVMHHADSHCEAIVEDMAEIGIDIWQGVLPQNDIPAIQKKLKGKMALMGGIDAAIVDRQDASEDDIRAEVRRCCDEYVPGGCFIPCLTYGLSGSIFPHVDPIIADEIDGYSPTFFK